MIEVIAVITINVALYHGHCFCLFFLESFETKQKNEDFQSLINRTITSQQLQQTASQIWSLENSLSLVQNTLDFPLLSLALQICIVLNR